MAIDERGNTIYGYSWLCDLPNRADPRFRVHVSCLQKTDRVEVEIIAVPRNFDDRPMCDRCGMRLG